MTSSFIGSTGRGTYPSQVILLAELNGLKRPNVITPNNTDVHIYPNQDNIILCQANSVLGPYSHWVCIKDDNTFFDPMGFTPDVYIEYNPCGKNISNSEPIHSGLTYQPHGGTKCGELCLLYCNNLLQYIPFKVPHNQTRKGYDLVTEQCQQELKQNAKVIHKLLG